VRRAAATGLGALLLALSLTFGTAAAVAGESGVEGAAETAAHPGEGEHAAEGGEEAEHRPALRGGSLALQLLNFAALLAVLIWAGGRAANRALQARHQQLKAELAAAATAKAAAEAQLAKQEARLASLEKEIAAIRAGIKQEAEVEKARLIAAADERARRIREETTFLLDQQVKDAETSLRREVAEAAVQVAEELVRRSLDGRDQQRLLDTFVGEVASGDGTPAAAAAHTDGTGARPTPPPRSEA
jgi:F-type H+-transporting ATPase subunit b